MLIRKKYDIKQLKVKRRGLIPGLEAKKGAVNKVRITIALDQEIVDYFKSEAKHPGAFPYQTQINQALRKIIHNWQYSSEGEVDSLKQALLGDTKFIHQLVKKIDQEQISKRHSA